MVYGVESFHINTEVRTPLRGSWHGRCVLLARGELHACRRHGSADAVMVACRRHVFLTPFMGRPARGGRTFKTLSRAAPRSLAAYATTLWTWAQLLRNAGQSCLVIHVPVACAIFLMHGVTADGESAPGSTANNFQRRLRHVATGHLCVRGAHVLVSYV
jgi:hypothetical protein